MPPEPSRILTGCTGRRSRTDPHPTCSNVAGRSPIPLLVTIQTLGPFGTNCYVVGGACGDEAIVIDPGDDPAAIRGMLVERGLRCVAILVTHGHIDHVGAVGPLAQADSIPVYISHGEAVSLSSRSLHEAQAYGFAHFATHEPEHLLVGGERLELAGLEIDVLPTPGHSAASVSFLITGPEGDQLIASGDVLFAGSVGRTDLEGGDWATLERSLLRLYEAFPPDVLVLPGHGAPTTLADEARTNPYLDAVRAAR